MDIDSILARLTPYRKIFVDDEDFSEYACGLFICEFEESKFMLFHAFNREDLNLFKETLAILKEKFVDKIDQNYVEAFLEYFTEIDAYEFIFAFTFIVYYSKEAYGPMLEVLLGDYVNEYKLVFEQNEEMIALRATKMGFFVSATYESSLNLLKAYKRIATNNLNKVPVLVARNRMVWCEGPIKAQVMDIVTFYKHPVVQYEYLYLRKYGKSMGIDMLCSLAEY